MSRQAISWVSLDTDQTSSIELAGAGLLHIARASYNPAVVNQGSRVEGMTKQFGVSICIDQAAESSLAHSVIMMHETAVDAVIAGRWTEARDLLRTLPENDEPANFLRSILQRSPESPPSD